MSAATVAPSSAPPTPYRGLAPYREQDAERFFGREQDIAVIANNVLAARLTVLYGPSGVGKSSVLAAGVVPRLRQLADRDRDPDDADVPRPVVVLFDDWGGDPERALIALVAAAAEVEPLPGARLTEALEDVTRRGGIELLLVLDGLEDYLGRTVPGSGWLDDELPALLERRRLPVRVLIAVREDALASLDRFREGTAGVFDNPLRLDLLEQAGAGDAIEAPLRDTDVTLEPGLAEEVVRQLAAAGDTGRIEPAYLQLVMSRLWATETAAGSRMLRHETLDGLGDTAAIVRAHLDAALDALAPHQQEIAAKTFDLLVTPSGARVRHTTHDLAAYTGEPEQEVRALLERLSDSDTRIVRPVPPPGPETDPPRAAFELFLELLAEPVLEWREHRQAANATRLERRTRRLLTGLITVTAVAVGLIVMLWNPAPVRKLELRTIDARFDLRGSAQAPADVVLVTNDDASTRRLGGDPASGIVSRDVHAEAIERIASARPRVVAYDVAFVGDQNTPAADNRRLVEAVRRAGPRLVLGVDTLVADDVEKRLKPQLFPALEEVRPRTGFIGVPADPGDVVRRIDSMVELSNGLEFRTLAFHAAQIAAGPARLNADLPGAHGREYGAQSPRTAWIDYAGRQGTIRRVSFSDLLDGRVPPGALRDKLVVVGNTSPAIGDRLRTAAAGGPIMDGPEIQANALATLVNGVPLRDVPALVDVLLILLLAGAAVAAARLRRVVLRVVVVVGAAVALLVVAQLAFQAGWIVAVVVPLLVLALATAGLAFAAAVEAARHQTPAERRT